MLIYLLVQGLLFANFICISIMLNVSVYCSGVIILNWGDLIAFGHL